jgi:outer membrane protein assembly factor BamB
VFLVGATAIGVGWLTGPRRAADPALPQVQFSALTPVGVGIAMRFGLLDEGGAYGMASVVGDRAFVAGRTPDGSLRIGAIDLATGRPAWPTRDLGHWGDWNGMTALPQGVIVIGEHDDGTDPDHVAMVIDPASGALRWQVGIDDLQFEPYESLLVVLSSREHLIRGLDWRTGTERWRRSIDPAAGAQILGNQSTTAPPVARGPLGTATPSGDHRLLLVDANGTLHVYNARTGDALATHREVGEPASAQGSPRYQAYDGTLYAISATRPTRLRGFDLDRPDGTHTLYTAAPDDLRFIDGVTPCGTGRICLISGGSPGPDPATDTTEIVAIDEAKRRELWRRPAPGAQFAAALGNRILTGSGQLYDRDGRQLLNIPHTLTGWVTPGSLLALSRPNATDTRADVEVAGVSADDGARTPLGRIPTMSGYCSWSTTVLVCPTAEGFKAWQFATG